MNSTPPAKPYSQDRKILFAGPVGSGKTTAITCLSDIPIVNTDQRVTDMTLNRKKSTTVALDYGVFHSAECKFHLYGTPGQERFDFMWEILRVNIDALILLFDDARHSPADSLRHYIDRFAAVIHETPTVIVLNRVAPVKLPEGLFEDTIRQKGLTLPVLSIDARKRDDWQQVMQILFPEIQEEFRIV